MKCPVTCQELLRGKDLVDCKTVAETVHSADAGALASHIPAWTLTDLSLAVTRSALAPTTLTHHNTDTVA